MGPLDGIIRQATTGLRNAPQLRFFTPTPTVEGELAPRGATSILTLDEHRQKNLGMLMPRAGLPSKRRPPFQA